jgi:hypothetical protein
MILRIGRQDFLRTATATAAAVLAAKAGWIEKNGNGDGRKA